MSNITQPEFNTPLVPPSKMRDEIQQKWGSSALRRSPPSRTGTTWWPGSKRNTSSKKHTRNVTSMRSRKGGSFSHA